MAPREVEGAQRMAAVQAEERVVVVVRRPRPVGAGRASRRRRRQDAEGARGPRTRRCASKLSGSSAELDDVVLDEPNGARRCTGRHASAFADARPGRPADARSRHRSARRGAGRRSTEPCRTPRPLSRRALASWKATAPSKQPTSRILPASGAPAAAADGCRRLASAGRRPCGRAPGGSCRSVALDAASGSSIERQSGLSRSRRLQVEPMADAVAVDERAVIAWRLVGLGRATRLEVRLHERPQAGLFEPDVDRRPDRPLPHHVEPLDDADRFADLGGDRRPRSDRSHRRCGSDRRGTPGVPQGRADGDRPWRLMNVRDLRRGHDGRRRQRHSRAGRCAPRRSRSGWVSRSRPPRSVPWEYSPRWASAARSNR